MYISPIHKIANFLKLVGLVAIIALPISRIRGFESLATFSEIVTALFFILDVLLLVGFCYAFLKAIKYRPHFEFSHAKKAASRTTLRKAYFKDRWQKLLKKCEDSPTSDSMRLGIIEADALVDRILKDMGFPGEHLADRLSNFRSEDMRTLNKLWDAHRVRNDIVHRPGAGITVGEGKSTLGKYEAFLKELEIL